LPGWVDTKRFRIPNGSRDEVRARLGQPWEPAVPTFFTLRRLMPRMGIDTLIEATAALTRAGRDFHLIIAGEGPERRRLEAMTAALGVAHRVRFVGRISEQRLCDSYAAADCFVLPTKALECFGLIVLEAYACGVPVIGVPVGAIPEVMGRDFAPWIAEDNRAVALARRMDDFLAGRLTADPGKLRARAVQFDMSAVAEVHEGRLLG
jgi:glycosyltransferase involved in cell wall biosynthesis